MAALGCGILDPDHFSRGGDAAAGGAIDGAITGIVGSDGPEDLAVADARLPDAVTDAAPDVPLADLSANGVGSGDASIDSTPRPGADCGVVNFPINRDGGFEGLGNCGKTECHFNGTGMQMKYCLNRANPDAGVSWAICVVSEGTSVRALDVDDSGEDITLEVRVCVDGPVSAGDLSLWFGAHPWRKRFTLISDRVWKDGTPARADQCRTLFFHPSEAYYPDNEIPDAGRYPGEDCTLHNLCGVGGPACAREGGLAPQLSLAAEFAGEPTGGTVRLIHVRHHTRACECQDDGECPKGASCTGASLGTPKGRCGPDGGSRSLCLGCEAAGTPCEVVTSQGRCTGEFICLGGKQLCNCSP